MALPLRLPDQQMQQLWKAQLDPVIANPLNNGSTLTNVSLKTGVNVINHKLGRVQQGWSLLDKQSPGDVYRTAAFNSLTLTLTATADMVVTLGVY